MILSAKLSLSRGAIFCGSMGAECVALTFARDLLVSAATPHKHLISCAQQGRAATLSQQGVEPV
jgi:hypothetical protein